MQPETTLRLLMAQEARKRKLVKSTVILSPTIPLAFYILILNLWLITRTPAQFIAADWEFMLIFLSKEISTV